MADQPHDITQLLSAWRSDPKAGAELMPLVYEELRRIAERTFRGERPNHTLQPTAVVNEAFMKLTNQRLEWKDRNHFFGIAAQMMRRILVDHARSRRAQKREQPVDYLLGAVTEGPNVDLIALDDALQKLGELDADQARIVELKYFAGLTNEEVADVMSSSPATVKRAWQSARAFLFRELSA